MHQADVMLHDVVEASITSPLANGTEQATGLMRSR